jgi:hypothetical protein
MELFMFKFFKEKLLCPIISSIIQLSVILLFFLPSFSNSKIHNLSNDYYITKVVDQKLQNCGPNYWISWIVIDTNNQQYYFQDVRGIKGDKIISPKYLQLNPFYNEIHAVDIKTLKFLSNFENGAAGYYSDMLFFDNLSTAKEIINSTNEKVYNVGISVTKNVLHNLVYVFLMTSTGVINNKCSQNEIIESLEDLSNYAKGLL